MDYMSMIITDDRLRVDKTLGYVYFNCKGHPLATNEGRVYYHRHVASVKVGHWLTPDEPVHHKDGDKRNNDPDNLEVTTFSMHGSIHSPKILPVTFNICPVCGTEFPSRGKQICCSLECSLKRVSKFDISKEDLEDLVWKIPTERIGKMFGVSGKAIEKRCKKFGIDKPPRGYWAQRKAS